MAANLDDDRDDDRTIIRAPQPAAASTPADERTIIGEPVPDDERTRLGVPPPSTFGSEHGNGLPIGTQLGEFEITSEIGEGGFGIVYMAYDHSLQRKVALKEYMPSSLSSRGTQSRVQVKSERHRETFEAGLKSFINEARLLASFDHPSLVKVYRFWEANGTAYMVMPLLDGITLKDRLRELGAAPDEAWLLALLDPLTEALEVIHAQQCYHRDIAPDNVMLLAATQRWLLLDFGAARRVIGDMTQALTVILKPGYAPVEQYAEIPGMKQGAWTDVYALAAVVYYAITGKTPPPSVGRLLNDTYVPLVECAAGRYSERFLAAIDRALIVRPEGRTQSIAELRADLGLTAGATPTAPARSPSAPAAPLPRVAAAVPNAQGAPAALQAAAGPAAAARSNGPMLAIGGGAVVVAALAFGAYKMLAPAPHAVAAPPVAIAPPTATPATPAPAPTPTPAPEPAPAVAPAQAPSAAAPAPAPPAGLDPLHEFDRLLAAQAPEYALQLKVRRNTLRIGKDELAFDLQSAREGYLYVFVYDGSGGLLQLLPNTVSGTIKLRAGQRYRFPSGDGVYLQASEPPGAGAMLALVTARQRDYSGLEPTKAGAMRALPNGADAAKIMAAYKGSQPILAGRTICPSSGACDESFGAAEAKIDVVK